jgi:hypothetical protein
MPRWRLLCFHNIFQVNDACPVNGLTGGGLFKGTAIRISGAKCKKGEIISLIIHIRLLRREKHI